MTELQLHCPKDGRRAAVRDMAAPPIAVEHVEVLPSRRTLVVHCNTALPAISRGHVELEGGVRTPVHVETVHRADVLPGGLLVATDQQVVDGLVDKDHAIVVRTDSSGDFSTYRLRLRADPDVGGPQPDFDRVLASAEFSFKVDCPSDFDCRSEPDCPEPAWSQPRIDYLAKDYVSFRRLMLDRLAQTVPGWQERNPADLGIALVELFAYAFDQISYRQDAAGTEAYMGTARRRPSVRRHARLVDYTLHDGANARTWLWFPVDEAAAGDPPTGGTLPAGTTVTSEDVELRAGESVELAALRGAAVFQTLHDVDVLPQHTTIPFYTWGDPECCLPAGATRAALQQKGDALALAPGDVLIFEEVLGPVGPDGRPESPDPSHRHAVRLTEVGLPAFRDKVTNRNVVEIAWHEEDALPFALCLHVHGESASSVAHGNVVLADHGCPMPIEALGAPNGRRFRPFLERTDLTHAVDYVHEDERGRAATRAANVDPRDALPALRVAGEGETWKPVRDLISSDRFAAELVVEMEEDGRARVRFGDGVLGRRPRSGSEFAAAYRIGNGRAGNVGRDTLTNIVPPSNGTPLPPGVAGVSNPLPAMGGTDPQPMEEARLYAPHAFRTQERAVTEEDYARVAERHPDVQRAAATRRWTGSWHTMFVTVDRRGGAPIDARFEEDMRAHLDAYRLAGYDVEIDAPRFAPLDVQLWVCVEAHHVRADVKEALLELFSARELPGGRRGLFHPDNFTFGQTVYLSPLVAAAMSVPGVGRVEAKRFRRWRELDHGELELGRIEMGRLEIARLDNDVNVPENGRLELDMAGGL